MDFEKLERLDKFGQSLARKRKEAMDARKNSGIEDLWKADGEFYEGIDDANRDEISTSITKNRVDRVGSLSDFTPKKRRGSNVFMNITRQYVDIAASSLSDMLLPIDDSNYALKPTPKPVTFQFVGAQPQADSVLFDNQQIPREVFEQMQEQDAKQRAEAAQKQIDDWLVEAGWHREVRQVIKDAARIGTGVLKGCYPIFRENKSFHEKDGVMELVIAEELKPASKRIDPLNFFPDPACGTDIHTGSYVWERDFVTAKQLRELKSDEKYIRSQIEKVLEEGADYSDSERTKNGAKKEQFTIWYYYGTATAEDLKAADCDCEDDENHDVMVVIVNDRVIKVAINPLESGEFPYDVMVWQPMMDTWTGIGIARQIREPQRILNAATRNLLDNAGRGGSPILVLANGVESANGGRIEITKDTILRLKPDAPVAAQQAVSSIIIPIITNELMAIIQYAQKMAEDITGLPMMLQGQQGSAPDTVGGMTMLQNNAGTIRRNIARYFDDKVTVRHIKRYYEYLMLHGDEKCKGDFNIEARGSSVLFERDAENMAIMQMGQMVMNPAFGIDPKKWIQEALKAQKLDPKRFLLTEEEIKKQQDEAQQNPPPQDPSIAAAQIRVQGEMQKAQLNQSSDMAELQLKEKLLQQEFEFKAREAELERQHAIQMAQLQRDMKMMELSEKTQISIAQIKSQLAQTSQKLNVQAKLSTADLASKQVITPPTEPVGRAENGREFQQ